MINHLETYILTEDEKTFVAQIVEDFIIPYSVEKYDEFMFRCHIAKKKLPQSFFLWREKVKNANMGIIKNLPIDNPLRKTPTKRYEVDNIPMLSDKVIGMFSALFGNVYSFEGKSINRHIHNVYPTYGDENTQLGYSTIELEWHVEDGFHPARPNWIGLFCLRGDQNVITKIARCIDIVKDSQMPSILYEPRFKLRIDDSFTSDNHMLYYNTSILTTTNSDCQIIFDPYYTVIDSDDVAVGVSYVKSKAEEVHSKVILEKGDLLLFDNRRVIHSRTAYHAKMDGYDRWVKRVLILDDSSLSTKLSKGIMPIN